MKPAENDRLKTFAHSGSYGELVEITNDAGNPSEEFDICDDLDLPTARRLVAAWNAAIGISTEALENGVIGQILDELEIFLADLEANIADGRCGFYHRDNASEPCPMHAYRDRLKALVAKAKGQPAA